MVPLFDRNISLESETSLLDIQCPDSQSPTSLTVNSVDQTLSSVSICETPDTLPKHACFAMLKPDESCSFLLLAGYYSVGYCVGIQICYRAGQNSFRNYRAGIRVFVNESCRSRVLISSCHVNPFSCLMFNACS